MGKHRPGALALAATLALAACGGSSDDAGDPGAAAADAAGEAGTTATADAAGDLRCPAKVRKELAGPDIIGLRLGMTVDEALATARKSVVREREWVSGVAGGGR